MMRIVPSEPARLAEFGSFWDAAVAWQARHGVPRSPTFPEEIIVGEIAAGRHFMGLRDDDVCAGFFSLTLADPAIWGERDRDDAVYIHRMCGNPQTRGVRFASEVLAWAHGYAASNRRAFVRMDTWADNSSLVAYYQGCGYRLIGQRAIGNEPSLSSHYHGITLALFENPVTPA